MNHSDAELESMALIDARTLRRELLNDTNPVTIYRWVKSGRFPKPFKIGGKLWWKRSDVFAWIAAQSSESAVES